MVLADSVDSSIDDDARARGLRDLGWPAFELVNRFTPDALVAAGYTPEEIDEAWGLRGGQAEADDQLDTAEPPEGEGPGDDEEHLREEGQFDAGEAAGEAEGVAEESAPSSPRAADGDVEQNAAAEASGEGAQWAGGSGARSPTSPPAMRPRQACDPALHRGG